MQYFKMEINLDDVEPINFDDVDADVDVLDVEGPMVDAFAWHKLLPDPAPSPLPPDADRDMEVSPSSDSADLLALPPEILSAVSTWLTPLQVGPLRLACRALYVAASSRISSITLQLSSMHHAGRYSRLSSAWLHQVRELRLHEPNHASRSSQPWLAVPAGCSPVCLWLLLHGSQLDSLHTISMRLVPYMLEALCTLRLVCPHIRKLEVLKSQLHDFSMEAFWDAVAGFVALQDLMIEGWDLQLADLQGLEKLTQLEALHVKRSRNFPTGLRCLSYLTGLRSITLEEIDYPGTIPQEFCGLSQLTKLESVRFVTVGPLTDEILALAHLSRLKTLEISQHYDEYLIPALYLLMTTITSLESITIPQFELTDGLARHLALQPNLHKLVVGRWRLASAAHPGHGSSSPGSALLQGQGTGATAGHAHARLPAWMCDGQVATQPGAPLLPHVRHLSLRCHGPEFMLDSETPDGVPALGAVLPCVSHITLQPPYPVHAHNMFSDDSLNHLACLFKNTGATSLTHLESMSALANVMAVRAIPAGVAHLRRLTLNCRDVFLAPADSLPPLADNDMFEPAPLVAVAAVGPDAALPAVSQSTTSTDAPPSQPPTWMQHLHLLQRLCVLELRNCQHIGDGDCEMLAASVPANLAELDLDECPMVSDVGMVAFGTVIKHLRRLSLMQANGITATGVVEVLRGNSVLQHLQLNACSPVAAPETEYIMRRFVAAGRSHLNIECRYGAPLPQQIDVAIPPPPLPNGI